jgi:hypothetical protein
VLSGKLPVGYSKLVKLVQLFVKSNLLTGNIPKEYSTLIKLTYAKRALDKCTTSLYPARGSAVLPLYLGAAWLGWLSLVVFYGAGRFRSARTS